MSDTVLSPRHAPLLTETAPAAESPAQRWFEEEQGEAAAVRLLRTRTLHRDDSGPQRIDIFDSAAFGPVLALDGFVQTTSDDGFIYHEMLAHVPLFAHGAPRDVLIVGGGDGGTLREVLRHPTVERVVLVEIDPRVIELSRRYLPGIGADAFRDPRVEVVIADGAGFVRDASALFDVILVDSTDPVGPGRSLFAATFFGFCRARLRAGGILVAQGGVAFLQREQLRRTGQRLRGVFGDCAIYTVAIPSYCGGPMAFAWAAEGPGNRRLPVEALASRFGASGIETRCYTPALHCASFVLPGYLKDVFPAPASTGALL